MDADQKFDYPLTVETTDVKASSPPQLLPPTVKTCVRLNSSDARNVVYCSLFSVSHLAGLLPIPESNVRQTKSKMNI